MEEAVIERVSFAYRELDEIDYRIVQKFGPTVRELDMSNNNIQDLSPLEGFSKLQVLVMDGNRITSHTKIPLMSKLQTLWVNSNNISNLTVFIDKLVESTPSLKFLSMLKNEACPNFFNGHSLKDYNDYRRYVINRLPGLTCLDSTPVTDLERAEGERLYSSIAHTASVVSPINKPINEVKPPTENTRQDRKKHRNGRRIHKKSQKSVSATQPNSLLPTFSPDSTGAPPPAPGSAEDDFDDSSYSSEWSEDEDEEWGKS